MILFFISQWLFLTIVECNDLRNISGAVFGESSESFTPAAFGDFNSDKLTDMIVFTRDMTMVQIMLATEQSVVSVESSPVFMNNIKSLQCSCPDDCIFVSAAPGDFDGDGSMDLMTVTSKDDLKNVIIFWGEMGAGGAELECQKKLVKLENISHEPLVFDYNGDYAADLLTVQGDENQRVVYQFSKKREVSQVSLSSPSQDDLKSEHGNAFVDVTEDGRADLVLTTQSGLEIYEAGSDGSYKYHCTVQYPELAECSVDQCIGQPVFFDFSLSGSLDMILPVCNNPKCEESRLYLIPVKNLSNCPGGQTKPWEWEPMSLELKGRRFLPRNPALKPGLQLMSPRVGDVNLDGFPDLLMTFYNESGDPLQGGELHLLLNVACTGYDHECQPVWRQFQLEPEYTRGVGLAVAGAWFDLYEDGRLDLMVIGQDDQERWRVSAFTNTSQESDSYFLKVLVLSGACYHNCDHHSSGYVPYGTNTGGQLVSYRSQRPGQETFDSYQSVAVQLPQTSHYALGLPFTIFGLGMAPNFVDYLSVNISGMSHDWPQLIPNSQLFVIPFPPTSPDQWDLKLIITASKNIVITGLTLVGTCALCTVIIVMLHLRQKRQDRLAKLQEGNRFHFDAM